MKMTPTDALTQQTQSRAKSGWEKQASIYTIAVAALIVVATTMLRSRSSAVERSTAAMAPLQELHAIVGVNKLSTQEIEDQSLVYPTVERR